MASLAVPMRWGLVDQGPLGAPDPPRLGFELEGDLIASSRPKPAKNKIGRGTRPAPVPDAAASVRPEHGRALHAIFAPTRVAVVGASEKEGSVGRAVFWNLITNPFGGTVFPVNPKRTSVLGVKAYPSLSSLPEPVDLVVVVTPAAA